MSYEPTQWKAGDTVTSAKLNKIEQGIAANGGVLIIPIFSYNENFELICNMTFEEIKTAIDNGNCFMAQGQDNQCYYLDMFSEEYISFARITIALGSGNRKQAIRIDYSISQNNQLNTHTQSGYLSNS